MPIDLTNPLWGSSSPRRGLCPGGKVLGLLNPCLSKALQSPRWRAPLHGHLLNLLVNGDLNLNGLCYRFDEPPLGLFFSQKSALSCGKSLRIAKSLPFSSAPKPALARPSSWPLAESFLQWKYNLNGFFYRFDEPPSGALLLPEEGSVLWGKILGLLNPCLSEALQSPLHGHLLNLLVNGDLNLDGFFTLSPYEWTFPYHEFVRDEMNKLLRARLRLPLPKILYISHVLLQTAKGLLFGDTGKRAA